MEKVDLDLESTGNAYLEIGRSVTGEIGYVGHIPATTMRVRRLRDGFTQIISGKVVYFRNFNATNQNPITDDPRPNEVIHFKSYSPLNTFTGFLILYLLTCHLRETSWPHSTILITLKTKLFQDILSS